MRPDRLAIVIATFNELSNLERLIPELVESSISLRLIIVDDNSPDGTADCVRRCIERYPEQVVLVERPAKLGYGSAMVAGIERALDDDVDAIVTMDADYSHDPAAIPDLLAGLAEADVCIGSRYIDGIRILNWSMSRLLLSAGANLYVNSILRFGISDCTSGFRAYRSDALRAIDLDRVPAKGYAFLVEVLEQIRANCNRVVELPIIYTERRVGQSKMSRKVIAESVFRPWLLLARRWLGGGRAGRPALPAARSRASSE